jgi:hypothetical protein
MRDSSHVYIVDETEEPPIGKSTTDHPALSQSDSRAGGSGRLTRSKSPTISQGLNKSMGDFSWQRRTKGDRKPFERTATGSSDRSGSQGPPVRNMSGSRSKNTSFVKRRDDEDNLLDDNSDFDIATDSRMAVDGTSERSKTDTKDARNRRSFWKTKSQEGIVDQSVNLMDAESGKYEREQYKKRGGGLGFRQKSLVDVFLQDSDHEKRILRWGGLGDSLSDPNKNGNQGVCRPWIVTIFLFLLVAVAFVVAPYFGLLDLLGKQGQSFSPIVLPTAAPTMAGVAQGVEQSGVLQAQGTHLEPPGQAEGEETPAEEQDALAVDTETDQGKAPTLLDIIMPREQPIAVINPQLPEQDVPVTEASISQLQPDLSQVPHDTALEAFRFYVIDQDVSEEAQLDIMGSPTKKALHWITQKDPARLPIPGYSANLETTSATKAEYALLQRYALAVFYFAQQASSFTASVRTRNAGRQLQQDNKEEMSSRQAFDDTWLSADPICLWQGVVCHEDFESVLEVSLPNHLLQGTIPRELLNGAAMPFLSQVDLTGNQIQGGLPQVTRERETAGQQLGVEPLQAQLRVLKLGQNQMTGNLNQLMGLTHLKEVDLSQNQITGSVPDSVSDLKHLGR